MNITEASVAAGYASPTHTTRVEQTNAYKEIEEYYYKNELLKLITLQEIAEEHAKNIRQDSDKGAKNKAIQMALSRVEPSPSQDNSDEITVILLG